MLEPSRRHFFAITSVIVAACSLVACAAPVTGQNDAYETAKPKKKTPTTTQPESLPPPPATDAGSVALPVESPVPPLVTVIEPATFVATPTPQPFKVRLSGSGFSQGSTVRLNDQPVAAVFANSSSATVTIPVENLKQAGIINFVVVTATSPPLKSSPIAFTVTAATPPPVQPITLTTLTPSTLQAGQGPIDLVVSGSNFTAGSSVRFNGVAVATTVTNPNTVIGQVLAAQLATAGTFNVTVVDPAQSPSNTLNFTVTPAPTPPPTTPMTPPGTPPGTPPMTPPVKPKACAVTCATAGAKATGCIAKGTYAGGYCASDGCAYDGGAYGCSVYLPGQPPPPADPTSSSSCKVTCAVAKMTAVGCVSSGAYAGSYCASDKCLYQGASYGCGVFTGSSSGSDFPKKCETAGGTYTGSACQCAGDSIYTNPYYDDCNSTACRRNGGEWTGSACACSDGGFINQFFGKCESASSTPDPNAPDTGAGPDTGSSSTPNETPRTDEFAIKCAGAGGEYTGTACKCAGDSIFVNPYADDCNVAACRQNGGDWTGSACACADGLFINQFFDHCATVSGPSGSGSDFPAECTKAGGEYTGTACQCPGENIFTNPYVTDCNAAACSQNGGSWTGSACGCTDGSYINPFFSKCGGSSSESSSSSGSEFSQKCTSAGGEYTGTACKCAGDNIYTNPYANDCNTAACSQNGGSWTGAACGCSDGRFINQFFDRCSASSSSSSGPSTDPSTDPPSDSSSSSSSFGSKCSDAGGTYDGSACKCPGVSIYTNPYAQDCSTTACIQNGGSWSGSTCMCTDGTSIDQFYGSCSGSSDDSGGEGAFSSWD